MVITGHDYRSGAHFGRLHKLAAGDIVLLTDIKDNTYTYVVYKLEHIKPDDVEALSQTQYRRELSLLTCEKRQRQAAGPVPPGGKPVLVILGKIISDMNRFYESITKL